jgi:hypothetical protein
MITTMKTTEVQSAEYQTDIGGGYMSGICLSLQSLHTKKNRKIISAPEGTGVRIK